VDGDPPLLQVHIRALQQANFRRAQAMAVGQEEEGFIALVLDDRKETFQLLLREELHFA
jgi:hypothetical protein